MKRRKKAAAAEAAARRLSVSDIPGAEDLINRVDPYRKQFVETVGPYAEQARRSGAQAAHVALERVTPALDDALDRVSPAVDAARAKLQGDLLPRLNTALAGAAGHPVAVEAAKRGKATAAALRGEVALPEPKKKSKARKVFGVLAIVAAVGGAAVAVKKYLDSRDAEWEAPAPSTYGGSNTPKRAETSPWAAASDKAGATGGSTASTPATPTEPAAATPSAGAAKTEDPAKTAPKPEEKAEAPAAADAASAPAADEAVEQRSYGAGSYVGSKPPKGFDIKGNERSMKFHTPDSPAYERTISDVWFNSAEAAENNGFTRAQR